MPFPTAPFIVPQNEKKADTLLLNYLRDPKHVTYLSTDTRKFIDTNIVPGSLRQQNEHMVALWPMILTDALRTLKKKDSREWDGTSKLDYGSFFHKGSLGVTELEQVLESFSEFESMLYGASRTRYRDHIAHVFRVWLIGHAVLRDKRCLAGNLFADKTFDKAISAEEWECIWAIPALCHDLGYPLQNVGRINSLAKSTLQRMGLVHSSDLNFSFSPRIQPFHEHMIRLMASRTVLLDTDRYATHLQNKYYMKLLKSFDKLEHGVLSALLVSRSLVYFLESDLSHDQLETLSHEDARQFLIRRDMLRAMAFHTCQDVYHLRFDTLPFLLFIMDELQEWGRPSFEDLQDNSVKDVGACAEVQAFTPKRVVVLVRTNETGDWTKERIEVAKRQLGRLHCMLRLGVGTSMLKDHHLEFAIGPKEKKGVRLLLKDGSIAIHEVAMANVGH